ncbi:MAG: YkgJ family cysteine cluster protein [Promethearchaeota archaeon]
MVLSEELRFECTRCGNCCTDQNTIVNTTYFDILRIKNGLNLTLDELIYVLGFYLYRGKISERIRKKLVISPIIIEKGLAFVGLFKKESGDCYFYNRNAKECTIYNLRPQFCKTFPFSFKRIDKETNDSSKEIKIFISKKGIEYCPGLNDKSPQIYLGEWLKLGMQTLEEIEKNENVIYTYNSLIQGNKLQPSVRNFLNFLINSGLKF